MTSVVPFLGLFTAAYMFMPQEARQPAPIALPGASAQIVMVDAVVLDRKGRPIAGVGRDEFELLEDGRVVPIEAFEGPKPMDEGTRSRTRVDGPIAAPGSEASGETRTLVVYVDRFLLSPRGRRLALEQIRDLSRRFIASGARVLVLSEDRGLKALTPVTTDVAHVESAIDTIQAWATQSPGEQDARRAVADVKAVIEMAEMAGCDCVCSIQQSLTVVRGYATFREMELREAVSRLGLVVNALIGLPGTKALVYVGEGLEQRPGIHLYDQLLTICPALAEKEFSTVFAAMQEFETSPALREVTARANAARVSLYPLDSRGLAASATADFALNDRRFAPSPRSDMVKDANLNNPLQLLAEETGGFAMLRGLGPLAAMKKFDADERGRYVLGFVPGAPDGRVHRLQVRLTERAQSKRRATIRHRQAYLRAPQPERGAQLALSALFFGLEEDTLGATVSATRAGPSSALVRVTIGAAEAAAARAAGSDRARVVIALRARDDDGAPTMREKEIDLPDKADEGRTPLDIVVDVPVGPAAHEFAVRVEDGSGRTTTKRVMVPAAGP